MALLKGIKAIQQSASAGRPHVLGFATARGAADGLFEVWNGETDAALVLSVVPEGIVVDGTCVVDGHLVISQQFGVVRLNTADGADTGVLTLSGGGSASTGTGRGAVVELYGTDHATEAGNVKVAPGTGGVIEMNGQVVVTATPAVISLDTADGSDTKTLTLSAGGVGGIGTGRGAYIRMYGTDHASAAGEVEVFPGTGGAIKLQGSTIVGGSAIGFYGTTPIARQTGVAVSAAGIHAALVNLGLITA